MGFPGGSDGNGFVCNVGELGSIPGLGRSPWRREWLSTLVFRPGEFPGLYSPWGPKESDTIEGHVRSYHMLAELVLDLASSFSLLMKWAVFVIKVHLNIFSIKMHCMLCLARRWPPNSE